MLSIINNFKLVLNIEEKIINNIRFRYTEIQNYWISEYGDIINLSNYNGKYMKQFITKDGHKRIELKIAKGIPQKFYVHRLVYNAFVEKIEVLCGVKNPELVVEHMDSNPQNNYYKNLKLSTQKQNIHTAIEAGNFGNANCKHTILYDKKDKKSIIFNSVKEVACYLELKADNLYKIKRSKKFKERYEIVNNKSQQTIETILSDEAGENKGVEYHEREIRSVASQAFREVHGIQ